MPTNAITDLTISAYLTLWGTDELFHKAVTPWHILISNVWDLLLFHSLGNILYLSVSLVHCYTCHSAACIAIFCCGFNLHFPNLNEVECLFMGLLATRIYSLVKCLFQSSLHFSIGLFDYYLVLHILDTRLLFSKYFLMDDFNGGTPWAGTWWMIILCYVWRQFLWEHIMPVSPSQTCSTWVKKCLLLSVQSLAQCLQH